LENSSTFAIRSLSTSSCFFQSRIKQGSADVITLRSPPATAADMVAISLEAEEFARNCFFASLVDSRGQESVESPDFSRLSCDSLSPWHWEFSDEICVQFRLGNLRHLVCHRSAG
jgi:hypothetical protein